MGAYPIAVFQHPKATFSVAVAGSRRDAEEAEHKEENHSLRSLRQLCVSARTLAVASASASVCLDKIEQIIAPVIDGFGPDPFVEAVDPAAIAFVEDAGHAI